MITLRDKTILLISPQSWGMMFLSKHHYAIELAKNGNTVYFLNPPMEHSFYKKEKIEIIPSGIVDNLFLINHRVWFPHQIRFHAIWLFHVLMRPHVKKILQRIPATIDIVWSFDLGNYYPFRFFGKKPYKIFHPVDEPLNKMGIDAAKDSDIIFSVTPEILQNYAGLSAPKYFINHGISEDFSRVAPTASKNEVTLIRVGISGNLLRNDIDRQTLMTIIAENPSIQFEFFGSYRLIQSNISGREDGDTSQLVSFLQSKRNVVLHGAVPYQELAARLQEMDAFLICYDIKKDQSSGTNYHKIMEYLSLGKVIISNNVTTYQQDKDLLQMTDERENNDKLPQLFQKVIKNLDYFNDAALQRKRIAFAHENAYHKQIERIEKLCSPAKY
jgi:hypothetical protein